MHFIRNMYEYCPKETVFAEILTILFAEFICDCFKILIHVIFSVDA